MLGPAYWSAGARFQGWEVFLEKPLVTVIINERCWPVSPVFEGGDGVHGEVSGWRSKPAVERSKGLVPTCTIYQLSVYTQHDPPCVTHTCASQRSRARLDVPARATRGSADYSCAHWRARKPDPASRIKLMRGDCACGRPGQRLARIHARRAGLQWAITRPFARRSRRRAPASFAPSRRCEVPV